MVMKIDQDHGRFRQIVRGKIKESPDRGKPAGFPVEPGQARLSAPSGDAPVARPARGGGGGKVAVIPW